MRTLLTHILEGCALALSVTSAPLYRYPYRNSAEALRGDWQRVTRDVSHTLERFSLTERE
jgi:hypothetical protein